MNKILKVDETGRIIIPKKIREKYNMKPYDTLLLSTTEEGFTLKKETNNNEEIIKKIKYLETKYNMTIILADTSKVIYSNDNKRITDKKITKVIKEIITNNNTSYNKNIELVEGITYKNTSYTSINLKNNNKGCLLITNTNNKEQVEFIFDILK